MMYLYAVDCIFFCLFFCLTSYGNAFMKISPAVPPTLSHNPGRKRLIGCNVRPISVSVSLFPCVNALSSKDHSFTLRILC